MENCFGGGRINPISPPSTPSDVHVLLREFARHTALTENRSIPKRDDFLLTEL